VSERQIQWWCEHQLLHPRLLGHTRFFLPHDALEVLLIAEMRRKGISLVFIRRALRFLRRELHRAPKGLAYFITDGRSYLKRVREVEIVQKAEAMNHGIYLLDIGDHIDRVTEMLEARNSKRLSAKAG
jgi:DNA-binding transcriptional MerR regulator